MDIKCCFLLLFGLAALVHSAPVDGIDEQLISFLNLLANATTDEVQVRGLINLNAGVREDGDELLKSRTDQMTFGLTPMPVTLMVKYPDPGVIGKRITQITGFVSFIGGNGRIWVSAGGVGFNSALVSMSSPRAQGYFYTVSFYGK